MDCRALRLRSTRVAAVVAATLFAFGFASFDARAQGQDSKPIRVIVPFAAGSYTDNVVRIVTPFAPGGGTDIFARMLAQHFSETLGQTFIVENRPGAGSTLGTEHVAKSAAKPGAKTPSKQANGKRVKVAAAR